MGSANLALVFGPTLTRAPSTMDPRSLHNDVPAVNLLIQLCITLHRKIFGGEEEKLDGEEERSPLSPTAILPTNTLDAVSEAGPHSTCSLINVMTSLVTAGGPQGRGVLSSSAVRICWFGGRSRYQCCRGS